MSNRQGTTLVVPTEFGYRAPDRLRDPDPAGPLALPLERKNRRRERMPDALEIKPRAAARPSDRDRKTPHLFGPGDHRPADHRRLAELPELDRRLRRSLETMRGSAVESF